MSIRITLVSIFGRVGDLGSGVFSPSLPPISRMYFDGEGQTEKHNRFPSTNPLETTPVTDG